MKRNKKLIITLTALVLAVVGAISAVTYVLSATSQKVTVSSLQVTYTANNVSATVALKGCALQSGTLDAAPSGSSVTFTPAEGSTEKALTGPQVQLGGFDGDTFKRYAVYQFSFKNNYAANHGTPMDVIMYDTYSSSANSVNVYVAYQVSTSSSCPAVSATLSDTAFTSFGGDWTTSIPGKFTVEQAATKYVYMLVAIDDATTGITYSNNGISFDLLNHTA